ncbi:MAG: hypothetical protein ACR2MM_02145, partial [Flavobacteriaceae bacterium]
NLTIAIEDGNPTIADLSALATDAELAALPIDDADADPANEIQTITSTDGSVTLVQTGDDYDLSVAGGSTDDQDLTSAVLAGSNLTIAIEDGNPTIADLSALATDAELAALPIDDADADPANEIQTITSTDGSVTLVQTGDDYDLSVSTGGNNLSNTNLTQLAEDRTYNLVNQDLSFLNGDIGIGTPAPSATLHVAGDLRLNDEFLDSNGQAGTNGQILSSTGTATDWIDPASGGNLFDADLTLSSDRTHNLSGNDFVLGGAGNVAIGTLPGAPQDKLDVDGQIRARNGFASAEGTAGNPGYGFYTGGDTDTGMFRATNDELGLSTGGNEALRIDASQNVGIGLTNPSERLDVNGNIRASNNFISGAITLTVPDYVFEKYFRGTSILNTDYEFITLAEIESFIKTNNHLPGIKSAKEVQEDGYWNLSESNLQNLEKIEELFIHTINQEKKINQLESKNQAIQEELNTLKAELEAIKSLLKEN